MAFDGRRFLALALLGRFFVELATAKLGQHTGFFTGALEATQGCVEILVFFETYAWHAGFCRTFKYKETRHSAGTELGMIATENTFCKAQIIRLCLQFGSPAV